ncbi:MAG: beta-ketoacyl synthase chain length factor [Saprospiraceae bacterium]|nr:beta-ketoacyl synthase chain length factor [Saprospiraceae bacterium]
MPAALYIESASAVSPAQTLGAGFPDALPLPNTNRLRCIEPEYKDFIDPRLIRRMSRVVKMGTAAAIACLREAGVTMPGAILTGTAYGCTEDTEVFLQKLIAQQEEMLTPTAFIQSTHNTIGAQIALLLQCHAYNNTYVHRALSFEHALLDGCLLLEEGAAETALVGGVDEITDTILQILQRFDLYKNTPAGEAAAGYASPGTIAGEGAAFFLLRNTQTAKSICRLNAVQTWYKPADLAAATRAFLAAQQLAPADVELVLLGKNGDIRHDGAYDSWKNLLFPAAAAAVFKPVFGEFPVASALGTWLAVQVFAQGRLPAPLGPEGPLRPRNILIYNQFYGTHHSLILLSAC